MYEIQFQRTFTNILSLIIISYKISPYRKNGTQDPERTHDTGPYEDPGPYGDGGLYENPGSYEDVGPRVLIGSWVFLGSWVLIGSWVLGLLADLGPIFPVCCKVFVKIKNKLMNFVFSMS